MKLVAIQFAKPVLIAGSSMPHIILTHDRGFVLELDDQFRFVRVSKRGFQKEDFVAQVYVPWANVVRIETEPKDIDQSPLKPSKPVALAAPVASKKSHHKKPVLAKAPVAAAAPESVQA
jgi:hypothetical protein